MDDRQHDDPNAKVKAIVDDAIAELLLLGMETRDDAASLMAIQAIIRIESNETAQKIAKFAAEMAAPDE